MYCKHFFIVTFASLALFGLCELQADERPNVILIMVDDMGFSDLGCYGSEIETPNLDKLAKNGLRFTQFYNCAKCESTRSTMLSGRYYPEVGNTNLKNCVTIAEGMKEAGYQTIMTGKWHLKDDPVTRGFDKYFGHLSGATNFFWGDDTFRIGTEKFDVPRDGFYTTDANTDYAIKYLKAADPNKPFFLYIAHNAPHYPLQAPEDDVRKYLDSGTYSGGWDKLRRARFKKQQQLGLFPADMRQASRPKDVPAWGSLSDKDKRRQELMMATFAAMVDRVDQNLGRLIEHLEATEKLDNTLILFLSDNGACPFQRTTKTTLDSFNDPDLETLMPWDPRSYWVYDKGWAHACNTPFREYKQNQHEGGICTPMIAHWPAKIKKSGSITRQASHLVDISATCFDLAGYQYPSSFRGKQVGAPRGLSLQPIFEGKTREPHEQIFQSFYGKNNALRVGDWKIVNTNFKKFELYNLAEDRAELNDLSNSNPEKLLEMKKRLESFFEEVGEQVRKKEKRRGAKKR